MGPGNGGAAGNDDHFECPFQTMPGIPCSTYAGNETDCSAAPGCDQFMSLVIEPALPKALDPRPISFLSPSPLYWGIS